MARIAHRLLPISNLSRQGPRWLAQTSDPWFRLETTSQLAGKWVRLKWRTGLADPVSRPVLRCIHSGGQSDTLLPAAPFGRKEWIGPIPAETSEVRLSPVGFSGDFGFELDDVEVLSAPVAVWAAAAHGFLQTLHAIGALMIGRPEDFRSMTAETLTARRTDAYPAIRRRESRAFEATGIDGPVDPGARTKVHILISPGTARHLPDIPLIESLYAKPNLPWQVRLRVPTPTLAHWQQEACSDPARISVVANETGVTGWISGLAEHDRVAILPERASFAPNALPALFQVVARHPDAGVVFADEGQVDSRGRPVSARLKPGFDRFLLGKMAHLGHASFWRADLLHRLVMGESVNVTGKGRITGLKISRIMLDLAADTGHYGEIERQFAQALMRVEPVREETGKVEVAIIIPTRDRLDLLRPCVESVLANSDGPFRIVIIDNDSAEKRTLRYLDTLAGNDQFLVHSVPGAFNFSKLCNIGSSLVESRILVFLNNDTTVLVPDWLDHVRTYALDPSIGAVGAKLLYPSGKVQHSGVIAGLGGRAGHFEPGLEHDDAGYFGRGTLPHALSAVTGACLAVEREKFEEIGGFDATNLPVDLNDIDLCFRLEERGYKTVLVPDCLLCHHESASRGRSRDTEIKYARERSYFSERWLPKLRADPHFNPMLSLYSSQPRLG